MLRIGALHMLADIFGPCRCAARPGAAHRCVFADNDFNFICTMGLKPSHQKGTIYEPKMGTKYEPKMSTENHEKMSFSYAIGHPGLVPHLFNGSVVPDANDAPLD